jgi:hypothetical protein
MKRTILLLIATVLCNSVLAADSAREIVETADEPFRGTRIYSLSQMTVYRSGEARPTLELESYSMREDGKELSLSLYLGPARMKGTAYLMIEDDLWVRFASTGRIRKLSSSAKKNSAGGTDFSYYDMADSGQGFAEDYTMQLDGENENIQGERCYRITLLPLPGSDIPYEKVVCYITQKEYRYLRLEYYEDGARIKTLSFSDYRNTDGRNYPFRYEMENHTQPSRTEVIVKTVEFDSPKVEQSMFSVPYLHRIK